MLRSIIGFHQDAERHWVAELECGHGQHVRHDPPWQVRPWVVDENSRRERLGSTLDCLRCDRLLEDVTAVDFDPAALERLSPAAAQAYADARVQGLCHDGALEVALAVLRIRHSQDA
jgi:hypothetical protein